MSSKIKIQRICLNCGKEFMAYTTVTKYCSLRCNQQHYKVRKRNEKVEKSNTQTVQFIQRSMEELKVKPYLSIADAAVLFGISKRTIYRMINRGELSIAKAGKRSILRRSDFDKLFELPKENKAKKEQQPISEFYNVPEVEKLFFIKYGRLNTIIKENNIPKTVQNGKLYVSKPHLDRYFKRNRQDVSNITEWYSVKELQAKYGLSRDQVYDRIHKNNIPKQRRGKHIQISKQHFDELFLIGV